MDDMLQIAYTGLLVAANRFKKEKNNKFSTFAFYCIKGEILHNIRDNNLIKIPRWLQKLNTLFNRFVIDFESTNGRYPTKDEISSGINVSIESVDEILRVREISIYNKGSSGEFNHDEEIIDRSLIKSRSPKSFELVMEDKILIWDAVDRLKGLNKKILVLKYIFGFSQEEIGKKMGISQKTVSRNIKDSLEKIKEDIA
jgi:RNA polymerase sigma factor (sigma-70 family)